MPTYWLMWYALLVPSRCIVHIWYGSVLYPSLNHFSEVRVKSLPLSEYASPA